MLQHGGMIFKKDDKVGMLRHGRERMWYPASIGIPGERARALMELSSVIY